VLGDEENLLAPFPQEAGKVTVLKLNNGMVSAVGYWDPATQGIDQVLK
jgi:hypothetical protein